MLLRGNDLFCDAICGHEMIFGVMQRFVRDETSLSCENKLLCDASFHGENNFEYNTSRKRNLSVHTSYCTRANFRCMPYITRDIRFEGCDEHVSQLSLALGDTSWRLHVLHLSLYPGDTLFVTCKKF